MAIADVPDIFDLPEGEIDVEALLERIRAGKVSRAGVEAQPSELIKVSAPTGLPVSSMLDVRDPSLHIELEVLDRRKRAGQIPREARRYWLKRLLLRVLRVYSRDQEAFNVATAAALRRLAEQVEALQQKLDELAQRK